MCKSKRAYLFVIEGAKINLSLIPNDSSKFLVSVFFCYLLMGVQQQIGNQSFYHDLVVETIRLWSLILWQIHIYDQLY